MLPNAKEVLIEGPQEIRQRIKRQKEDAWIHKYVVELVKTLNRKLSEGDFKLQRDGTVELTSSNLNSMRANRSWLKSDILLTELNEKLHSSSWTCIKIKESVKHTTLSILAFTAVAPILGTIFACTAPGGICITLQPKCTKITM